MFALLASVVAVAGATGMTWLFFPRLHSDGRRDGVAVRILAGCAMLSCLMVLLLSVLPGRHAAWAAFAVSVACTFAAVRKGALPLVLPANGKVMLVLGSAAYLAWRLAGCAALGTFIPLEGTGNHDEFWYIPNVSWLLEHSLREAFAVDPLFPFDAAAGVHIGSFPRIGAETLAVMASALSGAGPVEAFVAVFALGSLLLVYAAVLGLSGPPLAEGAPGRVAAVLLVPPRPCSCSFTAT